MRPLLILALLLFQQPSDPQRFAALAKANESAPPEQRLAYNALIVAFTAFRDAHIHYEICLSGPSCASRRDAESARLSDTFVSRAWPRQDAFAVDPKVTLESSDAALNDAYEQLLATLPESCPAPLRDCLTQSQFRETERDWIRYRDAFVTYSSLLSSQAPPNYMLILLTSERSRQIAAIPKS